MNGHAVVIGGGIGGLLAAHALAGRFERVTILERSRYSPQATSLAPRPRRGVPQSNCLHLLLAAGGAAFDEAAPGWRQALVARGAVPFDASADVAMRVPSGWLPRTRSGITMYACSRSLLEEVLLNGLGSKPGVEVREDQQVAGLLADSSGARVTGVRIASQDSRGETFTRADLVVDASGAASRLRQWHAGLSDGAHSPVAETVVKSEWRYVSRWYQLNSRDAPDWKCLSIAPMAGSANRAAMILRAEENLWGVVLLARSSDHLPANDAEFLNFTTGLGDGELCEALEPARPVSPIHHYGRSANRLRHYERLTRWPMGLVALADSVCALDPYYGLGMTAAARGAVLLGAYLDRNRGKPVHGLGFQKELARLNAQPWQLATGCNVDGGKLTLGHAHIQTLYQMAPSHPEIANAILAVQHMLKPMESLMEVTAA